MQKHDKYKIQYEKVLQTKVCFDKLYQKSLQNNVIDKIENESFCYNFTRFVDENKS